MATSISCSIAIQSLILHNKKSRFLFTNPKEAVSFFGIVQRIYTLFSSSTKRWKVLLDNVSNITVKSLCNTRWESRVKSVKAIRFQAPQIRSALLELSKSCDDAKSKSEADSLLSAIENFEFLLEKKQFDENNNEKEMQASEEESFRTNYFLVIVDMAISSLNNRFEQLKKFESVFGFLFDSNKLKSLDANELMKCCVNFGAKYSQNNMSDVDLNDFFSELKVLPCQSMSALDILEFVKDADSYPNVSVAYRIMLTRPVTVASAERSFSKLKLLNIYLRSSMSQERLNGLAILCIEKDMSENINLDTIIDEFATKNARRSCFA